MFLKCQIGYIQSRIISKSGAKNNKSTNLQNIPLLEENKIWFIGNLIGMLRSDIIGI